MAKIWYVKEGTRPHNAISGPELNFKDCIELFGEFNITYYGKEPPEFKSEREDLTPYREPNKVFIEVGSDELSTINNKKIGFIQPFQNEGFYLVALNYSDVKNILKKQRLGN